MGDLNLSNSNINEPFRPCNIVLKAVNSKNIHDTIKHKDLLAVELNNINIENEKTRKIELSIYPNPTRNEIKIDYDVLESGSVQINLIDINGQLIRQIERSSVKMIGHYSISTSIDGKAGGFFIQLVHENHVYSRAIIKQ